MLVDSKVVSQSGLHALATHLPPAALRALESSADMSSIADAIYQRMRDDTEATLEPQPESELAKFFGGRCAFVTGGSDLLGKCLVEKLLRDCPELERLYLLVRTRKGQSFEDKCSEFFEDSVFDKLKQTNPELMKKLSPIRGDLTKERLGLSDEDYNTLTEKTDLIFHNGAATRLNEQVSVALRTNVLGTKRMLDLARSCKRLKVFLYVSTAFSHSAQRLIEEKFYRAPADLQVIDDMLAADSAPSGLTPDALKMLLGEWPNIFTFSKATAEDLVQQYANRSSFACCVFRPSVVISTYKEPIPGWCDKKNGPASFFLKIALGAVHVVYSVDYPCELVPADMAANAMLVCAWDAADRWQLEPDAFVYNYGTSQEKPITMRQIKDKMSLEPGVFRTAKSRRLPYVVFASNFLVYFILRILLDYIPALIVDALTIAHGRAPEAWSLVRESMGDMCRLHRFVSGNWRVRMPETLKACERLNARDRELFRCDPRELDWDDYLLTYWRGIKHFVLGESTSFEETKKRCPFSCPCKCPCKCVCLGGMLAIGLLLYSASVLFF